MGFFKKEEIEKEVVVENVTENELEQLINIIRKKNTPIKDRLITYFKNNFYQGMELDYNKCLNFIDFCSNNTDPLNIIDLIEFSKLSDMCLYMENPVSVYKLIDLLSATIEVSNHNLYINYMMESRAYYTDNETWFTRVYSVISNVLDTEQALLEDKMRVGIYPNLTTVNLESLYNKVENLNDDLENIQNQMTKNQEDIKKSNEEIKNISNSNLDKLNTKFNASKEQLENLTNDSLETIKRVLNINPSSKKEVLKEIEKQVNVIDAFNEKIDIKERYEKLLSLKNNAVHYHPKFDEVLKYAIAGNTICLDGPKKCGKLELTKQIAELLNLSFSNLGNIYDEVTQINGYYDFNTNYNKPLFQEKFENGGVVLIKNIDNAPQQAIFTLNNIVGNFSYNPYVFGDKLLTTPNKNFRLIMTNNSGFTIDRNQIDNLVTIKMDYDTEFESSLTTEDKLIQFLHELRKAGLQITTSTFIDFITHQNLGLINREELINNYIVSKNSIDLVKKASEELPQENVYTQYLKKLILK